MMINHARCNKKNKEGLTQLRIAAKCHQIENLRLFHKSKANLKMRTNDNETPLLFICKHMPTLKVYTLEEIKLINLVTQNNEKNHINIPDEKGYSPLHYAARLCSGRVVEELIRLGAQIDCQKNNLQLSALHCACTQSYRLDVVDTLVRHGAKVNPVSIDGMIPLDLAVASSSISIVKYLIDLGANINYRESVHLFSPIHVALITKRKDVFDLLVKSGADVNLASKAGLTCLHLAAKIGNVEIVRELMKSGADVNCRERCQSITPMHIALSRGKALKIVLEDNSLLTKFLRSPRQNTSANYKAVFFCLIKNGADVKSVSKDGRNAFHFALGEKFTDVDIMKTLLDSEIDVNAEEYDTRMTPLLVASRQADDETMIKLVRAGADVNALSSDGESSLHLAIEYCGDWLAIVRLLLRYGADINCKDFINNFTPLHVAAYCKGRVDVIKELINAGADVNATTKDGRNSLHLAAELGDVDNVRILIERGVNVKHRENVAGYTALHLAVNKTRANLIGQLVDAGVDVDAKDDDGKTPLHFATCYQDEMVKILVDNGACIDLQDNQSCTPLQYAIQHDNVVGLMIFIESGASVNDILYSADFDVDRIFHKRDVGQFVMKCLMELKALRFPIARSYKPYITRADLQSVYYKNCVNEVVMLKTHLLSIKVSLYDFLHMDIDERFAHVKNMHQDIYEKFRIYKNIIRISYSETVNRKMLIGPAGFAFNWIVNVDLPTACTMRIFSYLKSWHLKTIVSAVENKVTK